MGQTFLPPPEPGGPPGILLFVAPRESWTMLDDWGDTLGLKGSGSHSIRLEGARIPAHHALENVWMVDTDVSDGTPGYRLHGNPMYAGRTLSFFESELAAVMVGAARGALEEYESTLRTRKTQRPPIVERYLDPDYQRWFGRALGLVAAAEAMVVQCATQYMEICGRIVAGGPPFSRREDLRLNIVAREALTMAWNAMQGEIFRTAGTSMARNGQRLERIFRDMAMGWGHFGTIVGDWAAREYAKEHLGVAPDTPPRPQQEHGTGRR
jgi:3-hydroxy-9,10-secoandrosta-1,3,5(10)-triene-9,17-dione monooxygenase